MYKSMMLAITFWTFKTREVIIYFLYRIVIRIDSVYLYCRYMYIINSSSTVEPLRKGQSLTKDTCNIPKSVPISINFRTTSLQGTKWLFPYSEVVLFHCRSLPDSLSLNINRLFVDNISFVSQPQKPFPFVKAYKYKQTYKQYHSNIIVIVIPNHVNNILFT